MNTASFERGPRLSGRSTMRFALGVLSYVALSTALVFLVACDDDPVEPQPNATPTASISANPLTVPAGDANQTIVTLDGTASSDPDGDALSFSWNVPSGTFVGATSATSSIAQVTFPGAAPYTVTLTVADPAGASAQAQVTIGVDAPPNEAPTAVVTASPTSVPQGDGNQTVVTIDASGSSDPDGDTLSFSWMVPSGTFVGGTSATDETIQVTFPGAAPYTVTVTVDDGNGGTDQASITISLT